MDAKLELSWHTTEQNRSLVDTFRRERVRLRSFIRRRVGDPGDAEDVLQDVFEELVQASRLMRPVEQIGAWLFRVARNRITDLLRRRRTRGVEWSEGVGGESGDDERESTIQDWLPSARDGPEAAYARHALLEALDDALDELPEEQRSVFVAHELEGRSFKDLALASGVSVNTLLSRKRYAVLHLRARLQSIYDDFVEP